MHTEGTRRLAAVWFADIVGYSTLSSTDEDAALALVRELQEVAREVTAEHGGRVVKFVGDAVLAVFESVDGAVRAALALQTRFPGKPTARAQGAALRVGLHLGEVTEASDGDLYGDGVNVASRLQSKARPGQVAVGRVVKEMVRGRVGFTVERMPSWHILKGLGIERVYSIVAAEGAPVPSGTPAERRASRRAIAMGLTTAIVGFFSLMMVVAMGEEERDPGGLTGALGEDEVRDGAVRLNLGIEHYFAGELERAVESLEPFVAPPLRDHPEAGRALRYLARAHLQADRADMARATLAQMVNAEPPMALLVPSAESDTLMGLYYDVRRAALQDRAEVPPDGGVGSVVVFDLEVVLDRDDELKAELGPSVAQMIASELETGGVGTQYLWALTVGLSGESVYGLIEPEPGAPTRELTHALFGRLLVRDGQVALSGQIYDLGTGAVAASGLATGVWPDQLFEVVEELGATLTAKLARGAVQR